MSLRRWTWRVLSSSTLASWMLLGTACTQTNQELSQDKDTRGGQTGSLRPCQSPVSFEQGAALPEGDAAFVFHTGCSTDATFTLTDDDGEPVAFSLEAVDDGVVLLRSDEALNAGSYHVETPDGANLLVNITSAQPLPERLGTLTLLDNDCSLLVELKFDETVSPYLPLLKLETILDGGAAEPWFEFGTVTPMDGSVVLALERLPAGSHELSVVGTIAGETLSLASNQLAFDVSCQNQPSCALSPARRESPAWGWCALLCVGALARRRKRYPRQPCRASAHALASDSRG